MNSSIRLYEVLQKYIENEDDRRALVTAVQELVTQYVYLEKDKLATKIDVMDLKTDILQMKSRMKQSFRTLARQLAIYAAGLGILVLLALVFAMR